MSIAKDNIAVTAPIVPYLPEENDFPSHYAKYGCGGWREVEDIEERDNIPNSYRSIGMVVYVKSEKKIYILESGVKNTNWTEFNSKLFTNTFYQPHLISLLSGREYKVYCR